MSSISAENRGQVSEKLVLESEKFLKVPITRCQ